MQTMRASPAPRSDALLAGTPADRLNALWKLSVQRDLSDVQRIRAMLSMAAEMLDMDLVILGEFDDGYAARYVCDRIGVFPEGQTLPADDALCRETFLSRRIVHIPDLKRHGKYCEHPVVTHMGLGSYYGLPVEAGGGPRWVLAMLRRPTGEATDPGDLATMELIADWLGHALDHSARTAQLEHMALTDLLTGLPNRRAAEERLQKAWADARQDGRGCALALVDLDHFKSINDRYGHAVGDEVLKIAARRFEAGLREGDWVARWGGEEFLFVLCAGSTEEAGGIVERMAQRMRAEPLRTSVGEISLNFSAGVAALAAGDEIETLLEEIDQTLYHAKSGGRDRVASVLRASGRMNGVRLREALATDRIRHASQPIVDLAHGEAVADEALARVLTPGGECVDAGEFVDLAEGLGLMAEIDRRVIRSVMQACVARIADGGSPDFAHFVNVSPQFLARRDLVEEMLANAMNYCQACNVAMGPVKPVVLELTERQRIVSLEKLRADLQPFIDFGFRLALDDFGSGYSSYLYLAKLPVSFLKIEGWLISHMLSDRKVAGIVESLANFARKEGVRTVAEHVEDAEIARILADMGVDYAQGWHFGKPQLI